MERLCNWHPSKSPGREMKGQTCGGEGGGSKRLLLDQWCSLRNAPSGPAHAFQFRTFYLLFAFGGWGCAARACSVGEGPGHCSGAWGPPGLGTVWWQGSHWVWACARLPDTIPSGPRNYHPIRPQKLGLLLIRFVFFGGTHPAGPGGSWGGGQGVAPSGAPEPYRAGG